MSDGSPSPRALSLASHHPQGGLWYFKHVLSTYCVPGTMLGTSPHRLVVRELDEACGEDMSWVSQDRVGGHGAIYITRLGKASPSGGGVS